MIIMKKYKSQIIHIVLIFITFVLIPTWFNDAWQSHTRNPTWYFVLVGIWIFYGIAALNEKLNPTSVKEQTIINTGAIGQQTNIAHKQEITNTTNIYSAPVNTPIEFDDAKLAYWRNEYSGNKVQPPLSIYADDVKIPKMTHKDSVDNTAVYDNMAVSSGIIKSEEIKAGKVITAKVYAKADEVLALRNEKPAYIVRKVFNVNSGGSRTKYIAAIEELIRNEDNRVVF